MKAIEAYKAGFMLKCASLGLPNEFAQVLYADPARVIKQSFIGSILGHGVNLGSGILSAAGNTVHAAGQAGAALGKDEIPLSPNSAKLPASLSDDVLRNILLSAHYRKAQQVLDSAKVGS